MGTDLTHPWLTRPVKRVVDRKIIEPSRPIPGDKPWLIRFTYDHYCQGYEDAQETLLVYAASYTEACIKVTKGHAVTGRNWQGARDFINLTLE